jgi:16S rRNA processing protein RimM
VALAPPPERLEIGRILKPHGLRGELRVQLYWDDSDAFDQVEEVLLLGQTPELRRVVSVRSGAKGVLLTLDGVTDRDGAELLRDVVIAVERAKLQPPAADEYYLVDLIGAVVLAPDGVVGRVVEIAQHPSCDAIVIETDAGERLEQALLDPWIESIDDRAKEVRLFSRDGLM